MNDLSDQKILVVSAHPDDETLGCGGTIARYLHEGADVRVIFMAEGITARFDDTELQTEKVKKISHIRNSNAIKALSCLTLDEKNIYLNDNYCCRLDTVPQINLVKLIEHHIKDFKPDIVFTHSKNDTNIDHRITFQVSLAATRPIFDKTIKAIYSYEVLSSTEWNYPNPFLANHFIDISDYIDKKILAMQAYEDEMREIPHPRSEEAIKALASYRGCQSGLRYAEAFTLIRSINN
tara:strand:- start:34986 stop:35693 length:708 start_codon:yes stop_codon:yes gene_type:complete